MGRCWTVRGRPWWPRFVRELCEIKFVFVPGDVQGAIEPLADDDIRARWRQGSLRLQELDKLSVEGDGPVVMDLAGVFKAEDIVEVDASSGAVDVGKSFGMSKASVVVIGEEALKQLVGFCDGGDVVFAQVFDETILMGSIGSFDAALGLGGMSIDALNTKTFHRLAKSS